MKNLAAVTLRAVPALLVAWLLASAVRPAAAQGTWTTYLNAQDVKAVALDGDGVWGAANGGARRFPRGAGGTVQSINRSRNGLSSDHLTAVDVTPDGVVWFGSDLGLSRWDRNADFWETIDHSFGVPGDNITKITHSGRLVWVGTTTGFAVLAGDTLILACASLQDSCLPDLYVNDILVGQATQGIGPYFFATKSGAAAFDGQNWTQLSAGLPPKSNVAAIGQLGSQLYCCVAKALYRWDGSKWVGAVSSPENLLCLHSGDTRLLVGRDRGVSAWDGTTLTPISDPSGDEEGAAVVDIVSSSDSLWVAAVGGGVRLYDGTRWTNLFSTFAVDEPRFNLIGSLSVENCGDPKLWFAPDVRDGALGVMDYDPVGTPRKWAGLGFPPLSGGAVSSILVDANCYKWVGHCCGNADSAQMGVSIIDDSGSKLVVRYFVNPPRDVISLGVGPDGKVYMGSGNSDPSTGYMSVFNPHADMGVPDSGIARVNSSYPAYGQGTLQDTRQTAFAFRGADRWIGNNSNGLNVWHSDLGTNGSAWGYFQTGDPIHGVAGSPVNGMAFTGDTLWVATAGGLTLIDAAAYSTITTINSADNADSPGPMPSNQVNTVASAPNGDVWIGTQSGLVRFRGGNFDVYSTLSSPLVNDDVTALAIDASKNPYEVWIGTAFGISRLVTGADSGCTTCPPPTSTTAVRFYPHPFRPERGQTLHLSGAWSGGASVKIYDARGRVVREFTGVTPGASFWDGLNAQGVPVGSGVYRVRVEADGEVHRLVLALIR